MRCRPGDLARIVKSDFPEDIDKLVWVQRRVTAQDRENWELENDDWWCEPLSPVRGWYDKAAGWSESNMDILSFRDDELRPIRDTDGVDETLRIAELTT